jgi:hypothetical protein
MRKPSLEVACFFKFSRLIISQYSYFSVIGMVQDFYKIIYFDFLFNKFSQ